MRKRNNYAVLEKKLKELESELNSVIAITRERPCHELLSESIVNRFLFLRKLLTAEVESHTYTETHHLRHIRQRLDGLETAFHEWDNNFKTSTTTTPNNHTDTVSACSCSTGSDHEDNDEGGGGDGCGSSGIDSPVYEEEEKENLQECVYEDDDKEENHEYIYEDNEEENRENTSVVTTVEEEENAESGIIIGKVDKSNVYDDNEEENCDVYDDNEEENCESTSVVTTVTEEDQTAKGRIIIGKVEKSNDRRRRTESLRSAIFGFILAAMLAVLMAWLSGFLVYEWEMETSFLTPT